MEHIMPLTLRVEFTGLCLFIVKARADAPTVDGFLQADEVTVVMPRCRQGEVDSLHADGTHGEFHVGYIRFDLAGLDGVPIPVPLSTADDSPEYEVVHRLTGQQLEFGNPESGIAVLTHLPDLESFAPTLRRRAELFRDTAGELVVLRTTLTGGTLEGQERRENWRFSTLFNPDRAPHEGCFAEEVVWTRTFPDGTRINAELTDFGAVEGLTIPLVGVGPAGQQTINVKLANLCCENPLEWEQLPQRQDSSGEDRDFKWLYRLLEDEEGRTYEVMLGNQGDTFPIPVQVGPARGGQGCVGLSTRTTG
jgi:hypothetical protein